MTTAVRRRHRSPWWAAATGAALLAGTVAAGIGALSLAETSLATGLPSPGPVTAYGLPLVRAAGEIAAAFAVGSFLLASFLVPPQRSGVLDVGGYRAMRTGTVATAAWAVCAAMLVPLTISDISGQPLQEVLEPVTLWSLADLLETAGAWRWTALIAAVVTLASIPVLRWSWTPVLLAGSLASLLPIILTGHSSAGGSHDLATNSMLIHVVAAALWAGGLLALLAHAMRHGDHTDVAARRFSVLAGWCIMALAISGVLNALVRITPGDLTGTHYGNLVIAKIAALSVLGYLGWRQRRAGLAALTADPSARGPLIRLALAEAALFAVTFGIAVGLGRTPPPESNVGEPSAVRAAIGYDLPGPPTMARVFFDWRFDLIFGSAAMVLAALYLAGVRRLRRRGDPWPIGRTLAWLAGCAVLLFATSSGVGRYMPAMFSMHMAGHMMLSMLAPILLVLGGPLTLALRALPVASRDGPPGPREWILAALHSRASRFLTHPVVALLVFVAGFYGLYFGGLFDAAAGNHAAHVLMNAHFVLSGYLFYWVVIGIDPTPRRLHPLAKVALVFVSLPMHAFFGVVLMGTDTVFAGPFYRSLQLGWPADLLADQRLGGGIAWAAGELPLVVVMVALLIQWRRSDQRDARRMDRAADRDDGAELAAYNAALAHMAGLPPRSPQGTAPVTPGPGEGHLR